jgi:hypothetical protein
VTLKIDRQLISVDDLFFIITTLKSVSSLLEDKNIDNTLEKI